MNHRIRPFLRALKCRLQIRYYRLRHVHPSAYIAFGSSIATDLVAQEHTYIGAGSLIGQGVSIGAYTMFGPRVVCVGDDHRIDVVGVPAIFAGRPPLRPTRIGRDVWVGASAILLSGVEIGDGAIVAAGTVVSSSIPACEIHGGIPNRKIRDRFANHDDAQRHLTALRGPIRRGEFATTRHAAS